MTLLRRTGPFGNAHDLKFRDALSARTWRSWCRDDFRKGLRVVRHARIALPRILDEWHGETTAAFRDLGGAGRADMRREHDPSSPVRLLANNTTDDGRIGGAPIPSNETPLDAIQATGRFPP